MARSADTTSRSARVRALPWAALLRTGFVLGERVNRLSGRDRARLGRLLSESRGWPGRLGSSERAELRRLIGKLDLKGAGSELAPLVRGAGRRRKRR